MMQKDGTVLSQQDGIFRTNCIDCLDRTNVVQSLIAKEVLQSQLTVSYLPSITRHIINVMAHVFIKIHS